MNKVIFHLIAVSLLIANGTSYAGKWEDCRSGAIDAIGRLDVEKFQECYLKSSINKSIKKRDLLFTPGNCREIAEDSTGKVNLPHFQTCLDMLEDDTLTAYKISRILEENTHLYCKPISLSKDGKLDADQYRTCLIKGEKPRKESGVSGKNIPSLDAIVGKNFWYMRIQESQNRLPFDRDPMHSQEFNIQDYRIEHGVVKITLINMKMEIFTLSIDENKTFDKNGRLQIIYIGKDFSTKEFLFDKHPIEARRQLINVAK